MMFQLNLPYHLRNHGDGQPPFIAYAATLILDGHPEGLRLQQIQVELWKRYGIYEDSAKNLRNILERWMRGKDPKFIRTKPSTYALPCYHK